MAIEPVKIPQNVYVEDRIIGPVTLRQLIIVLLSGGFSYAIWGALKSATGYVSIPVTVIAWIPCAIGIIFAFVKIQGIGLMRFCLLIVEKTDKPPKRMWAPRRGVSINFRYFAHPENEEKNKAAPALQPHHQKLSELSAFLDRGPITSDSSAEDQKSARDDFASLASEATPQNAEVPSRPVDPARVQTTSRTAPDRPMEDIAVEPSGPAATEATPVSALVQDIVPPRS